jgi:hypothetical protein
MTTITHYTLLQSAIPGIYLSTFLRNAYTNLTYFVAADDLLGGDSIHTLNDINEVFDLSSSEFKTIAVNIDPYKRMVLNYFKAIDPVVDLQQQQYPNYVSYLDCENFTEFVELFLSPNNPKFDRNSLNSADLYIDPDAEIQVSYLLDFDNFNTDIRTIPEFSTLSDVDYLAEAHELCAGYKDLYTEPARQRVAEVFAKDIATWNYTF